MSSYYDSLLMAISSIMSLKFLIIITVFLIAVWFFAETREIEVFIGTLGFCLTLSHFTRKYGLVILTLYALIIMVECLIQRKEEIENKQKL
ncbi:hypothetical protein [Caldanaerobacter subterraneus]|uniref:Uncharacterized protein n=1 Tax=Caldanaerobacter subterraneus TaxID=911092 RepID=A0A7Y2L5Y1_9THEO|nr:hypothetical protein [Caldanaerobacter subterraneus]NNG66393.1 hypothetical protein [Caldanaerobacter subterraneus]